MTEHKTLGVPLGKVAWKTMASKSAEAFATAGNKLANIIDAADANVVDTSVLNGLVYVHIWFGTMSGRLVFLRCFWLSACVALLNLPPALAEHTVDHCNICKDVLQVWLQHFTIQQDF